MTHIRKTAFICPCSGSRRNGKVFCPGCNSMIILSTGSLYTYGTGFLPWLRRRGMTAPPAKQKSAMRRRQRSTILHSRGFLFPLFCRRRNAPVRNAIAHGTAIDDVITDSSSSIFDTPSSYEFYRKVKVSRVGRLRFSIFRWIKKTIKIR